MNSNVSKLDLHNNSFIGKDDRLLSLFKFDKFEDPILPVLNEPVSVEKVNGPPKIDSLFGSGKGSDNLILEHEIKDKIIIIYKNRIIKETCIYK
tara:strand:+ start:741 stop:1022 length:282 start_codon:yes stop_codon:yes gene_type:complete